MTEATTETPDQHVTPETWSDARQHRLERQCWCQPDVVYEPGGPTVKHKDGPSPVKWLNYAGDIAPQLGRVMGPDTVGQVMTVVVEQYDDDTQTTRLGLAYGVIEVRP